MLPERMAKVVNDDLRERESECKGLLQNTDLIRRLFTDSVTEAESNQLNKFAFFVYGYKRDTLVYWNTNKVIGNFNDSLSGKLFLLHNEKGVFVEQCFRLPYDSTRKLVILFPIFISYPLENDYLVSHFVAAKNIPVKTKITADCNQQGGYPIVMSGGQKIFALHFNPEDFEKWLPDTLFVIMLIIACITSVFWIQLMIIDFMRRNSPLAGFVLTCFTVLTIKTLLYFFGLPFNLDVFTFFSTKLYHGGNYITSLGDLFIDILFVLWVIVFITRHTLYKQYFIKLKSQGLKYVIAVILVFLLIAFTLVIINVIRHLVIDSGISFDVSHFYAINIYTLLGLLAIGSLSGISCMIIYLFNIQMGVLLQDKRIKYVLVLLTSIFFIILTGYVNEYFSLVLIGWIILFILLLDIRNFTLVSNLFEPHMIFWAVFICIFFTGIITYFNQIKEKEERKAFVEQRLSPHRDTIMENVFDKTASLILKDKVLKSFLSNPTSSGRKGINQRFETQYLTGPINQYQSRVYLFDEKGEALFNKDTTDYDFLFSEKNESVATNSEYLFYKESILDRHYYLSYIPIYPDTGVNVLGFVIIDLDLKKRITETVYPELLQPITNKANAADNEYAYAIYINDKLITQTNDYPFTVVLKDDTLHNQEYAFYGHGGNTELYYKIADKRTVVVVHYHSELIEAVTLFSYLFGIQVILAILILFYRIFLSYFTGRLFKFKFMNLRRRVHFSMLAVILVSFIIIGSVTILFFTREYKASSSAKLQSAMQVVKQSVQEYLKKENAFSADYLFDSVSRSTRFKYFINDIANSQKIDVNIFDDRGTLFSASQDEIFEKGLISRKIRPDAFYQLNNLGKSLVIQDEKVAGLSYMSAYQPLRDEEGVTLGYIGVPFFSSEKDLNFQISNIVITLINLYAFIFLVSSIMTVMITRWIVKTFNIISKQFGQLNLQRNERLKWPYDDEIGTLVEEYNKMVQKVEENALLLAKSERESAWREMAKQIAHEIKNPLTPMKLNIQYLQQAIKNNNPNIKQLADRFSESIIEQIDNLTYIASEFSNFAKLPEAKPEALELGELLNKSVELYQNIENLSVTVQQKNGKCFVVADRSQLLRVFSNLLENAKQAIPTDRKGLINVVVAEEASTVTVAIEDNGVGISEEIGKKIFHPYFTTKTSGTGLGLAMTKKIIEIWEGDIWFETRAMQGTTFFVRLNKVAS